MTVYSFCPNVFKNWRVSGSAARELFPCNPPINDDPTQAATVFSMIRPGIEPESVLAHT